MFKNNLKIKSNIAMIGGDGFMLQTLKKKIKNSKNNFMELILEIMVF